MVYLIIFLNIFRFIGLENSPPGFYVDEAAGAVQAICIWEGGTDFYGNFLPLFSPGVSDAFYTPAYLYGAALWSGIFGNSIYAFRAFIAFISCSTILVFYLWVKNISTRKVALFAALSASIMPWSFHFSRIAWDPPVGIFFLVAALWACYQFRRPTLVALLFSIAAYSYSPLRISIPILLIFLPGIGKREKILISIWGLVFAIPLLMQMQIPEFSARSELLALWGNYPSNQYNSLSAWELIIIGFKQFFSHLNIQFLFLSGDQNIRHSIQYFGELSWLDLFAIIAGIIFIFNALIRNKYNFFSSQEKKILLIALLGIAANILPAALANQGAPHALRSIGCWPFYALLTGCILDILGRWISSKVVSIIAYAISLIFFSLFSWKYFIEYPRTANKNFLLDSTKINQAYELITNQKMLCKDVPKDEKPKLPNELLKIKLNKPILFASKDYGAEHFLGINWEAQESWGIWSKPDGATLNFFNVPKNSKSITLSLRALISPIHPRQFIEIRANGGEPQSFTLERFDSNNIEFNLNGLKVDPEQKLEIQFFSKNAISPIDAGISKDDDRLLGIGLVSATFK